MDDKIYEKFDLSGNIAIVTGGSRGIGKAISLSLAGAGADVIPTSRTKEDVKAVVDEIRKIGGASFVITTDVTKMRDVQKLVDSVVDEFGKVDVLVNNAGTSPWFKPTYEWEEEEWKTVIDVNLNGTFRCIKYVASEMIDKGIKGSIINVVSVGAVVGNPRIPAYSASKGGMNQLTKSCAAELAEYGIRVNSLAPAYTKTEMTEGIRKNEDLYKKFREGSLLKRFAEPEEMGGPAVFLASDAASYVTGHTLIVDGGWTATKSRIT